MSGFRSRGRFRVEGLTQLEEALGSLTRGVGRNAIARGFKRAAQPVIDDAKARVAVRSGELRDSLEFSTKLSKRQRAKHRKESTVEVFVGAAALPHAHLVEFGTISMAPRPFMRPAWDANKDLVLQKTKEFLTEELTLAVERAKRKNARKAAKAAAGG